MEVQIAEQSRAVCREVDARAEKRWVREVEPSGHAVRAARPEPLLLAVTPKAAFEKDRVRAHGAEQRAALGSTNGCRCMEGAAAFGAVGHSTDAPKRERERLPRAHTSVRSERGASGMRHDVAADLICRAAAPCDGVGPAQSEVVFTCQIAGRGCAGRTEAIESIIEEGPPSLSRSGGAPAARRRRLVGVVSARSGAALRSQERSRAGAQLQPPERQGGWRPGSKFRPLRSR